MAMGGAVQNTQTNIKITAIPQCWWGVGQEVVCHNHTPVLVGSRTRSGVSQPYPSAGGEQDKKWCVTTIPQCWWGAGQEVVCHNHTPVLVGSRTRSGVSQPYPSAGGE